MKQETILSVAKRWGSPLPLDARTQLLIIFVAMPVPLYIQGMISSPIGTYKTDEEKIEACKPIVEALMELPEGASEASIFVKLLNASIPLDWDRRQEYFTEDGTLKD